MVNVMATAYTTTVQLGPGAKLVGAYRNYSGGAEPSITYTLKYFNKYNNQNYSTFMWTVEDSDGTACSTRRVSLTSSDIGSSKVSVGSDPIDGGRYRFNFTTKVNGTTYSGFKFDPVALMG